VWCCLCDFTFCRLVEHRLVIDTDTDRQTDGHRPMASTAETALTDTLKHTQAVSSANRVLCLVLLVRTSTDDCHRRVDK